MRVLCGMLSRGRWLIPSMLAVLVAAVAVASAAAGSGPPRFAGPTIRNPAPAPDFRLRDQHGRFVRLSGQRGKVVLVTFLYTNCPDLCPFTAVNLNRALGLLGPRRKDVTVLAVSVDPVGDTQGAIVKFVRSHRLRPQFHYLTGSRAALERVWRAYNVASVKVGGGDPDHTLYTLVLDRRGTTRVLFDALAKPAPIAHDVKLLLD